ncbi:hypothetical protein [Bradyrhizobium genosp. P]|uniref:hypothetical protein n=1 Tax=Bradyrhizobium genosp. P TaxID=83641 RepID=UPI003CF75575
MPHKIEAWHKRQALLLAGQLPESTSDVRMVIQAVIELLDVFAASTGTVTDTLVATVLAFKGGPPVA